MSENSDTERCPRCDKDVEPVHREWKYGPNGRYCPECGTPLHDVTITLPTTDKHEDE